MSFSGIYVHSQCDIQYPSKVMSLPSLVTIPCAVWYSPSGIILLPMRPRPPRLLTPRLLTYACSPSPSNLDLPSYPPCRLSNPPYLPSYPLDMPSYPPYLPSYPLDNLSPDPSTNLDLLS